MFCICILLPRCSKQSEKYALRELSVIYLCRIISKWVQGSFNISICLGIFFSSSLYWKVLLVWRLLLMSFLFIFRQTLIPERNLVSPLCTSSKVLPRVPFKQHPPNLPWLSLQMKTNLQLILCRALSVYLPLGVLLQFNKRQFTFSICFKNEENFSGWWVV